MTLAVLVYGLVASTRRRQRDLAVLAALGLTRRQTRVTLGWQAAFGALIAFVIGVPFGVAIGRIAWRYFAGQIGVGVESPAPWSAITTVLALTSALTVCGALVGGQVAARLRVRSELRDE